MHHIHHINSPYIKGKPCDPICGAKHGVAIDWAERFNITPGRLCRDCAAQFLAFGSTFDCLFKDIQHALSYLPVSPISNDRMRRALDILRGG